MFKMGPERATELQPCRKYPLWLLLHSFSLPGSLKHPHNVKYLQGKEIKSVRLRKQPEHTVEDFSALQKGKTMSRPFIVTHVTYFKQSFFGHYLSKSYTQKLQ